MAFRPFKVKLIGKGCASDEIIINATNVVQAKQFAKDQYPSMKIGAVRAA